IEQYQEEKEKASRTVTPVVSTAGKRCSDDTHRSCKRQRSIWDGSNVCEILNDTKAYDKFCYYWMEIGHYPKAFISAGWTGRPNNYYIRANIEEICSRIPQFKRFAYITGITTTNYTPFTDCVYLCCKQCHAMHRYSLLPLMRHFYLKEEISKAPIGFSKESAEDNEEYKLRCHDLTNRRVSHFGSRACISIIVADEKSGIRKYTGPMIMSYLTQIDPANFHVCIKYSSSKT
uniref:Uncharacterized protein n=1 Tax=Parascaris univalens TaxID=6257 RepID=A0A915A399_PARUN